MPVGLGGDTADANGDPQPFWPTVLPTAVLAGPILALVRLGVSLTYVVKRPGNRTRR